MSEPVDLTGMTPAQASRAVRAAAKTMEPLTNKPAKAKPLPRVPYSTKVRAAAKSKD